MRYYANRAHLLIIIRETHYFSVLFILKAIILMRLVTSSFINHITKTRNRIGKPKTYFA